MLSLSSHGLLICSSYSFLGVFILLSLIGIITLFSLSADACLHACTFCMLIKDKSVFLSALLNHCVCRRIYIRFFSNHFISQFLTVWFSLLPPSLCIDRISSPFPLTSLCPSSCLAFDINARNLNICSANDGVRALIWLLC